MFNSLSDRLNDTFDRLRGKGKLTEADITSAMRDIRMALLEADVNFKVVKDFVAKTKERCMTAEVMESLTPAQNVVKIVLDELTELLGSTESKLVLSSRIPNVIMLVGLQGSGKTTAAVKLAYLLKKQGRSPLLAACDVYRPAAADQLATLGGEIGVPVFRGDGKDPVEIARGSIREAVDNMRDVVIVDTAGRLQIDEQMMQEAVDIKRAVKPDQVLMVVDAMTGQDIVNVVSFPSSTAMPVAAVPCPCARLPVSPSSLSRWARSPIRSRRSIPIAWPSASWAWVTSLALSSRRRRWPTPSRLKMPSACFVTALPWMICSSRWPLSRKWAA